MREFDLANNTCAVCDCVNQRNQSQFAPEIYVQHMNVDSRFVCQNEPIRDAMLKS